MESINQERLELLSKNKSAWDGEVYVPPGKLDSALKKNSAFIKKIKISLNAENYATILKDIETLSLEKYLSEVLASLEESILKVSKPDDIMAAVRIISLLHQRFPAQLTSPLLTVLINAVVEKDLDEPISRVRNALKLLFEMHLVGLCTSISQCDKETLSPAALQYYNKFKDEAVIIPLLKDVMSFKPRTGYSLPIIVLFLKRYLIVLDDNQSSISNSLQNELRELFATYTTKLIVILEKHHDYVSKLAKRDKSVSIKTGKLSDGLQESLQSGKEIEEHMKVNISALCEFLDIEFPQLGDDQDESNTDVIVYSNESAKVWWEDSKERAFYKEIPTVDGLLSDSSLTMMPTEDFCLLRDAEKVSSFIQQLEVVDSELGLNKLVVIFKQQIPDNKATANRILRFFSAVPKVDNIKFYARFLAITKDTLSDMINELIDTLDRSFRSQMYHGSINFRNLYFFIELVKFKLVPLHIVFHKIRKMTMNLAGTSNVDILLIFYERCGKFLLLEPEYRADTTEMLKLLRENSKSDKLSINEKSSLNNMFLIVESFTSTRPIEKPKVPQRSAIEDFVIQLIRRLANPANHVEIANIVRPFAHHPEAQRALLYVYLKPEELPLDCLGSLAGVLGYLGPEHSFIVDRICDTLVEKVVRGLELNDYRQNVARTAQIKLLAALCNRTVLSFRCALDLLFKIICFGYPNNLPLPNSNSPIDAADDYFRIHLVCTFLKSATLSKVAKANLFKRGTKSIEGLVVFLQYYIFCKKHPLPKDIQFSIEDSFKAFNSQALEPFQRATDLSSAMLALQKFTSTKYEETQTQEVEIFDDTDTEVELELSEEETQSESELDESDEDAESENEEEEVDELLESEIGSDPLDDESSDDDEDQIHQVGREMAALEIERREADTLDRGIRELVNKSAQQAKTFVPFKIPSPSMLISPITEKVDGPMNFTLVTKRNATRKVLLPSNNQLAERMKREQAERDANRAKILSLINNMDS